MKMFILGVLAMSLFSTISFIICDNVLHLGEAERELVDGGPIFWLVALFCWLIFKVKEISRHIKYRGLVQDKNGNIYRCKPFGEFDLLIHYGPEGLGYVKTGELKEINTRAVPRKIWKNYPKIPSEVLQKARENMELGDEW